MTPSRSRSSRQEIHEHNAGDLTAVVDAGLSPARPAGDAGREADRCSPSTLRSARSATATLGGIVATADSGPLRHRYGSARDLVVGMTVALSDGTVAQSGGKVIKNVAGYDLSKLFIGSYGTLGAMLKLSVRLHPLSPENATAVGRSGDPAALAAAARSSATRGSSCRAWTCAGRTGRGRGAGALRRSGRVRSRRADAAATMGAHGLETEVLEDDAEWWGDAARGAALEQTAWWCASRALQIAACRPCCETAAAAGRARRGPRGARACRGSRCRVRRTAR